MTGPARSRKNTGVLGADGPALSVPEVVRRWPRDRELAVVCGGGPAWGTTLVGSPVGLLTLGPGGSRWVAAGGRAPFQVGRSALDDVRAALAWGRGHRSPGAGPRRGGWIVSLSYELGEVIEPAAARRRETSSWPIIEMRRCEDVFGFEHSIGAWDGAVEQVLRGEREAPPTWSLGELQSETGRERYEAAVARAIEYIRAGDVYQVNLAHRMLGRFSGSARGAFAALVESAKPWHGAYLESAEGRVLSAEEERWALMSASPELFLRVDGRRVMTRPMKGTWPASRDASELRDSGKDMAELNMIIDLMRNDLGRVCRFGTVKVEEARAIERHGGGESSKAQSSKAANSEGHQGVWQGVGTVVGELREGLDVVDLLAAAFPAGSVTGAPKIRAMQIIDELEVSERGPYCGSIGWIGDDGRAILNVAIRTACVRGKPGVGAGEIEDGEMSFSVGAGIVAESVPGREWEETLEKAGVLARLRS